MKKYYSLLLSLFILCIAANSQTSIIAYGSSWKYLDNGTNQGTAWRSTAFNDALWLSGNAQLGYGDGDETTVVSFGSNANKKYITTYFRKTISVTNAAAFTGFTLNLKRDDGAVVYINGTERFRSNMPTGTISYTTKASLTAPDDGNTAQTISLPAGTLITGTNVIAVEIHQRSATDADISFDLQLSGAGDLVPPAISTYSPADNATNISAGSNLVATFNEQVQKGTGNIVIKESGIITQTIAVSSAAVTVAGNIVTINPADFGNGAAVSIGITAGTFKDLANNNYEGITNDTTWNFNVIFTDAVAPTVTNYSPADNATNISAGANLVLTFSEPVQKGTGSIFIKEGGVTTKTIDVTSDSVTISGTIVTINPAGFGNGAAVSIGITAGTFKDLANNNYVGITNDTTWNFNVVFTDAVAPVVTNYSPADNATNISAGANLVLTFSEPVQKGTGSIFIKEGGVTTKTIDVTSDSVTISGTIVTINPASFGNGAAVSIGITAGTFKDLANNNYGGITNDTTWNFNVVFTDAVAPAVTNYSPADNATNISAGANLVLTFSEPVQKGTGNIFIKEAGVTTQTIDVSAASVTIAANVVTINPADFGFSSVVNIQITPGTFKDLANNNYAGILDDTSWYFNTEAQPSGPQTFITYGDIWKYLDNGTNQGTAWRATSFNDSLWASGNAQLGYGDGDETTVVSFGPSATAKYITTYFRKTIAISNPSAFSSFTGNVKRDDGVVIYINGTEVYRNNLPTGTIAYTTLASTAASDDGNTTQNFTISSSAFISGNNVIAVEMHQNAGTSSDLSFDLQLIGTVPGASLLTRGPYMNSALQNGIVIRWRTDVATNSKVNYGTTAGSLTQSITDNTVTTEHVVTLTGLTANTLYYYSIGSATHTLQGDANNYFKTMPVAGSTQKIRIMAMGDMGNNSTNQINVRNAWQTFNGSNYTDAWILLGDNAYSNGLDAEYQTNFFNIYQGSLTKNHVLWPAPGNHDYAQSAARQADHLIPYYDMFTLPSNGQAGGVASNTEAFYSYNYANVHFVALDSYGWETGSTRLYDTLGPQAVWLKQDLAANTQPWTVVYFHHPPYTKGSHNSDTETELINMRQKIVPILERYKVDLVLSGHSHSYERSYLINGHYGIENTFSAASHALSSSSAKYDGSSNSCTYIKNGTDVRNGIVYALVGSAGQLGGTTSGYPHDAMYYSNVTNGGTLYFEVENNRLAAKWIGADGVIRDNFTIMKNVNQNTTISVAADSNTTLTASWIGNYSWSTGATTQSINVSSSVDTIFTVTDGAGCITDVFNVDILPSPRASFVTEEKTGNSSKLFPTVLKSGQPLYFQSSISEKTEFCIIDVNGRILSKNSFTGIKQIQTGNLLPGIYFLKWNVNSKTEIRKFVIIN